MVSVALAKALAGSNRVLLVEADHHAPVFASLFQESKPSTFFNQYIQDRNIKLDSLIYKSKEGFDIIYASSKFQSNDFIPSANYDQFIERLLEIKQDFERSQYDFIIIDLPPGVNSISVSATVLSDDIIILSRADKPSLEGTETLLKKIYANTVIIQSKQVHIMMNQVPDHPETLPFIEGWIGMFQRQFPFVTSCEAIMYNTKTASTLMKGQFMEEDDPTNQFLQEFAKDLESSVKLENV